MKSLRDYISGVLVKTPHLIMDYGHSQEDFMDLITDKLVKSIQLDMRKGFKEYRFFLINENKAEYEILGGTVSELDYYLIKEHDPDQDYFMETWTGERYGVYLDITESREYMINKLLI